MELNITYIRSRLLHGDLNGALRPVSDVIGARPASERPQAAREVAGLLKLHMGDLDPIALERLVGRMFMLAGLESEGKDALLRAARWQEAQRRAESDFGLDFEDQAALYRYLGANDFRECVNRHNPQRAAGARLLLDENSVAYHIHAQQLEKILPLLKNFPGATWLTVGDGRMAFEARFLMRHGASKVHPTNLDPTLLEECRIMGLIEDYGVENVEDLSFPDKSFDFICCKDSLHHCLSPYKGLYEMLRVARRGIFLLEPFDHGFCSSVIYGTRDTGFHHFEEEAGNYAYSFSERELEKLCVSHGWRCLATRGVCSMEGHGIDNASTSPEDVRKQRQRVDALEKLAAQGKAGWVNMASILLRQFPTPALRKDLTHAGYLMADLPCNPHTRRAVLQSLDIHYSRSN